MRRTRRAPGFGLLVVGLWILGGSTAKAVTQESWDSVYIANVKVGFIHTFVEPVKDKGRELLRVRQDMEFSFKRLNDRVTIKTMYGTIETLDGSVLKLETRTLASNQQMTASGSVIDGKMTLTLDGGGQRQTVTMPWGPDVRGPYAAELSLSRAPMKAGETRPLRMYVPDLNKVCDVTLTAKNPEEIVLGGDARRTLLRIEETVSLEGKPLPEYDITLWADTGGQILKSKSEIFGGMDIYRTTREAAQGGAGSGQLNLTLNSIIRVTHKISRPEASRDIRYRVGLKDGDPSALLPSDRRQTIRPGATKDQAMLEVRTATSKDGNAGPEQVDAQFLRPNALVTSEDTTVREFAARAVSGAADPWEKAVRITHWVASNLKNKDFKTAFAPASEVAQTLSGDCTEHGVLVAAMCRAAGVPARVVVGLVYSDSLGGFGYHMWNEVYVNRRWVAVDAAFDQTDVDAAHIKLSDTSLDGVSPYEAFLPVVRVLGKMTLDPVEIR